MAADLAIGTCELANARLVEPVLLGRARVPHDRPLPPLLTQELSPNYTLVVITNPKDWARVREQFQLPNSPEVDLSRGAVVGILANVGESASGKWPIHLRGIRAEQGQGDIDAAFSGGVYYPLLTAGYLELAYAPDVHAIRMVKINNLMFAIRSVSSLH